MLSLKPKGSYTAVSINYAVVQASGPEQRKAPRAARTLVDKKTPPSSGGVNTGVVRDS